MPPKGAAADVVPINIRMPRKLHKRLEQVAKRPGNSITAEVIARLERSFDLEKWPSSEQLAHALMMVALKHPKIMDERGVSELIELLREAVFQVEIMDEVKRR
jgi:Arc-like DNA binding domain